MDKCPVKYCLSTVFMAILIALLSGCASPDDREEQALRDLKTVRDTDLKEERHNSDSLVLGAIAALRDTRSPHLAEALYLAGRVNWQLGDYKSALTYYHEALDLLPEDASDKQLRGNVLHNLAWTLNSMVLPAEAAPYLITAIKEDSIARDSVNLVYDLELLSRIYINADSLNEARRALLRARATAAALHMRDTADQTSALAYIELNDGHPDKALSLIRRVDSSKITPPYVPTYLVHAAKIYLAANSPDTAMQFARRIIASGDTVNLRFAYSIMLSDTLRPLLPPDSLGAFINAYKSSIAAYNRRTDTQAAAVQQAMYNYTMHDLRRRKAEEEKKNREYWIIGLSIFAGAAGVAFGAYYARSRKRRAYMQADMEKIRSRLKELECARILSQHPAPATEEVALAPPSDTRSEIIATAINMPGRPKPDARLMQSAAVAKLQDLLASKTSIEDSSPLWGELREAILAVSPGFFKNLDTVAKQNLTREECRTAMLIKAGLRPRDLEILFARSKGAVSSRRQSIAIKIFDGQARVKKVDTLLRML